MKHLFVITSTQASVVSPKHGAKTYEFAKAGLIEKGSKQIMEFCFRIITMYMQKDEIKSLFVSIDDCYIDYSEQLEMQVKGSEMEFEKRVGDDCFLIGAHKNYFNNAKQILKTNTLKDGDIYYELNKMYRWKKEVIEQLLIPIQKIIPTFRVEHTHKLYLDLNEASNLNKKVIVDIGKDRSRISFFKNKKLLVYHEIDVGTSNLICELAEQFAIPINTARILLEKHGMVISDKKYNNFVIDIPLNDILIREVPIPHLTAAIQGFYASLFRQLSSTLKGYVTSYADMGIVLAGEAIKLVSFKDYSSLYFNCENVSILSKSGYLSAEQIFEQFVETKANKQIEQEVSNFKETVCTDETINENSASMPFIKRMKTVLSQFISEVESEPEEVWG